MKQEIPSESEFHLRHYARHYAITQTRKPVMMEEERLV